MSVNASDNTSSQWLCSEVKVVLLQERIIPLQSAAVASSPPPALVGSLCSDRKPPEQELKEVFISLSLSTLSDG